MMAVMRRSGPRSDTGNVDILPRPLEDASSPVPDTAAPRATVRAVAPPAFQRTQSGRSEAFGTLDAPERPTERRTARPSVARWNGGGARPAGVE